MGLDLGQVRSHFPGLAGDSIYFDNAGGSLTLRGVVDRLSDYLLQTDVQLGATYPTSLLAAERYREARRRLAKFIGASRPEEVVFGPSSTVLLRLLAEAMRSAFQPGDELIVTRIDHESNIGPWLALEREGVSVRFWERNPGSGDLEIGGLEALLTDRTRLVAVTHVSNILGTINPVAEMTRLAHAHGAEICVDGVAYAPHRQVDVGSLGVDYYVLSLYKVFGPHHAILYGKHEALLALDPVNHYFFGRDRVPGKLEPGNANYELSYASLGIVDYLEELGREAGPSADAQEGIARAWNQIAEYEESLSRRFLEFLNSRADVRVIGKTDVDRRVRVPTFSFTHDRRTAESIVTALDATGIGIRHGHFYAARLIDDLGLDAADGVVRVSMVHYNSIEEVDRLVHHLARALDADSP